MADSEGGSRRTILIVEDDPATLKLLTTALASSYEVHGARSAPEAEACFASSAPALVILDVQLGQESGLSLLRAFRERSMAPVLVITGHGSEAVAVQALEGRANGYLAKPFTLATLRERVATLLAEGPRPEHLAERARALIEQLATQPVAAADLATRLAVPPRRLLTVFQARFGQTPLQYLRAVRLRQAQDLLVGTTLPVAEIATRVGFARASYFDRTFRRAFGVTPVAFRRLHVPGEPPPAA